MDYIIKIYCNKGVLFYNETSINILNCIFPDHLNGLFLQ